MYEQLLKHISDKINLEPKDQEVIKSFFTPKKLRKKQYLLQEGNVCDFSAFVISGCLRSFTVDDKGSEHIMQFATENWWINDMSSFLTGEPSTFNIDALEDTEMLILTREKQDLLFDKLPKFERYFRLLLQNSFVSLHKRLLCEMSVTAEDKYLNFLQRFPDLFQRVPQHMIASYLGLTPETLSRIRKKLAEAR
ncbi:MAG: Crp/Fnr family transcriptional regulator [Cytophagaceae bacterium]